MREVTQWSQMTRCYLDNNNSNDDDDDNDENNKPTTKAITVDCKNGHRFSPSMYMCPFEKQICNNSYQEVKWVSLIIESACYVMLFGQMKHQSNQRLANGLLLENLKLYGKQSGLAS